MCVGWTDPAEIWARVSDHAEPAFSDLASTEGDQAIPGHALQQIGWCESEPAQIVLQENGHGLGAVLVREILKSPARHPRPALPVGRDPAWGNPSQQSGIVQDGGVISEERVDWAVGATVHDRWRAAPRLQPGWVPGG